jgi:hypothetical protein
MNNITANDLKTKGISVIQSALDQQTEAVISVRGILINGTMIADVD